MDGDIIIAIVTGSIFVIGGGVGFGRILQKQNSHDERIEAVDTKVDEGFKANAVEHKSISKEIAQGNERTARIEGRLNGTTPE